MGPALPSCVAASSNLKPLKLSTKLNLNILLHTHVVMMSNGEKSDLYVHLLAAILSESRRSVALEPNSLEAEQGPQFHLAPRSNISFRLCN